MRRVAACGVPTMKQPMMFVPRSLLLCWLATSASVQAADLYKCTDKGGQVSIQSEPCPKDWTQVWKRDAAPELPPSAEQVQALEQRRQREREETAALARLAGTAPVAAKPKAKPKPPEAEAAKPAVPDNACRQAHAFADAARAKEFLELSNYQLSRLSEWVAEQCRDP